MPLLPAENIIAFTHLTYNFSIGIRDSTESSTVSSAVPAIAGGTAAGIILAVAAVMGWKWWSLIARHTRKHQSGKRKVLRKQSKSTSTKANEEPAVPSTECNTSESSDCQKNLADSLPYTACPPLVTPLHSLTTVALSEPPIKPPRHPARALRRPSKENTAHTSRSSCLRASNGLSYKASTISTASVYSTESEEQPQTRVPAAVIVAALGHTFGTRCISHNPGPYTIGEEPAGLAIPRQSLRYSVQSDSIGQPHRISNISEGSMGLQEASQSIAPVGMAYGGEEYEEPFYEVNEEPLYQEQFEDGPFDVLEGSLDHVMVLPEWT